MHVHSNWWYLFLTPVCARQMELQGRLERLSCQALVGGKRCNKAVASDCHSGACGTHCSLPTCHRHGDGGAVVERWRLNCAEAERDDAQRTVEELRDEVVCTSPPPPPSPALAPTKPSFLPAAAHGIPVCE
jgi:hypothetical protein